MPGNLVALTDGEVRATLVQIAQAITTQELAITTPATREGAHRENLHANAMASRLRDFTRLNPPVYYGSKNNEYTQEFRDEAHKMWRRVIGGREVEKARSLGHRIRLVLALVGVRSESRTGRSSIREIIEMPSVTTSSLVSVDVCMKVSAW